MIYQGKARYPVTAIIIHCTATPANWRPDDTPRGRVEAIRRMHTAPPPQGRGWRDIGYHWLIDRDGTVLPGRPETEVGAHVAGRNAGTIGVSLFGGLTSQPKDAFLRNYTPAQESALLRLLAEIGRRTAISEISGHRQYDKGKACPGFWVPDWLRARGIKVGTK